MWTKAQVNGVIFGLVLACCQWSVAASAPAVVCPNGEVPQELTGIDYRSAEGRPIVAVRYRTVPVFDPDDPRENNAIYRFLNRIHINTRESVIAAQLLFSAGDKVHSGTLDETERLLRGQGYLKDAEITTVGDCGDDGVVLMVSVRDVWTLEPQFDFGREGGETKHGFGVSEENLFGTGNAVSVGYNKDSERSSVDYGIYSPHLFNTRLTAALRFADTSDGQESLFDLNRPFYSLETPWAAGLRNEDITFVETIRFRDEDINAFEHESEYHEAFVGAALRVTPDHTQRILLGITQDRQGFNETLETHQGLPRNFNHIYSWLEYRFIQNQFAEYVNLDQMHQIEDISTGADFRLRIGHGGHYWGNEDNFTRYEMDYTNLWTLGEQHLMRFLLTSNGKHFSGATNPSEGVIGTRLGYYYLNGERHRWYIGASYFEGYQLPQYAELTAGGEGPRGFPVDYLRGDKRYLATVEKRYITNAHPFNLFRFGVAMYLDVGRAWGGGYTNAPHLANLGVGLRMSSSKAKIGKVLHLDLAVPLVERDQVSRYQLVMRASQSL